jgi:hypothetical protein
MERLRRLPLWAHVVALGVVLLALVPLLDDGQFSADEGAALAQVDLLDRTGRWTAPNPAPDVDPEAEALPLELALRQADGDWAPFNKHSVWIRALVLSEDVGGGAGPLLLSVVSVLAAAIAAAVLARRLAPGTDAAAAWAVGIGSPLLFDGYTVIAHTLGAALAGFAALLAVGAVDVDRPASRRLAWAAVAGVLALSCGLVRTEGALFAIALGLGIVVASARSVVRPDPGGLVLGVCVACSGGAARVLENRLDASAWGAGGLDAVVAGDRVLGGSDLSGRVQGFLTTWVRPAYTGATALQMLAGLGVLLLWVAVVLVLRRGDVPAIVGTAGLGAALVVLRLVDGPALVPGLLIATPVLAGLAALDGPTARSPVGRLLGASGALFALAVLATQYAEGGAGEWGGRYFALAWPLAVPLAVAGLRRAASLAPAGAARSALIGSFVAASLALAVGGVVELRHGQISSRDAVDRMVALRQEVGGDHPATVVATTGTIARFAWRHLDEGHWHTVARSDLTTVSARLAALGEPVILFAGEPQEELPLLAADWVSEPLAGDHTFLLTPK